jgi:hypothetical protein
VGIRRVEDVVVDQDVVPQESKLSGRLGALHAFCGKLTLYFMFLKSPPTKRAPD